MSCVSLPPWGALKSKAWKPQFENEAKWLNTVVMWQQGYKFALFIPLFKIPSWFKIWLFFVVVVNGYGMLFCVQGLTCGQWGCKQPKGGWSSKPGTESWSDTWGLNNSPPLAAGPLGLCKARETETRLERWRVKTEAKGWGKRKREKFVMTIYWLISQ